MTAKEIFEKLGFKLTKNSKSKIEYAFKDFVNTVVSFDVDREIYTVFSLGRAFAISPDLHKAIHKQIEELGWLDAD